MVVDGEVFFPPAPWLNDPFELNPRLLTMDPARIPGYVASRQSAWRASVGAEMSDQRWEEHCRLVSARLVSEDFARAILEAQRSEHGVLSMNETPESLLMWAHYGEGHRGYCIELRQHPDDWQSGLVPFRVEYQETRPVLRAETVLIADPENAAEVVRSMYGTKSHVWSYEREWRALGLPKEKRRLHAKGLLSITVGALMDSETRKRLASMLLVNRPHVQLYRARLDPYAFAIVRERVDLLRYAIGLD